MINSVVNFRIVFKVVSNTLFIISAALVSCVGAAIYFSEAVMPFILSAVLTFTLGIIFFYLTRKESKEATILRREAYASVTFSWLFISLVGCLPYLFSGAIPQFINAFFESVSGFTTTGSSILTDIESLPKSILFWRSLTHWIGGIGIIVLFIVIMPTLQISGYHLFTLESSLQEKIQPKIRAVGTRLLIIYVSLTLIEVMLLLAGNMNLYESVCHAFGTVATGGFSPKNDSIAGYSPYIQYVIMLFMLLAGTNFVIHYYIVKREFAKLKANEEFKFYLSVVIIIGLVITAALFFKMNKPLEVSFREAFFQVISIITCTGYATADYLQWPEFAWIIIFFAMFFGGSTGSTAGGIKMARHLILFKNFGRIFKHLTEPKAIIPVRFNKTALDNDTNFSIISFISIYLFIFGIGSVLLVALGIDATTAAGSVATTMAGIGPGIGTVGPVSNFAHLPEAAKVILSFLMLVGRLEIYTIIMLFTPYFWKK